MKIITIPSSGKLGLSVRMPGRYGQVERAWVVPANPQTGPQIAVRSRLAANAGRWDAQRLAWNTAAATMKTRSRLGTSGAMTGLQYFVQVNCNLDLIGQEPVDAPPAGVVIGLSAVASLSITNTGGTIAIKLGVPTSPGTGTMIWGAAPVNAGQGRAPSFRFLGICPTPAAGSSDITTLYSVVYGAPPVGKRVFIKTMISASGVVGPAKILDKLVPASA